MVDVLTLTVGLAVLVESLSEYVGGIFWKPGQNGNRTKVMAAIAAILGIVAAVVFQVDLLKVMGFASPWGPVPGQVITGIIASRGADFVHSIYKRVKPSLTSS